MLERGQDAGGYADDDGEEDAAEAQRQRRPQAVQDEVEHGLAQPDGCAQVGGHGAAQEAAVLHGERIVQAHFLAQLLLAFRGDGPALGAGEHELHRVAGKGVHDGEDRHRDEEEDDAELGEAAGEVAGEHGGWVVACRCGNLRIRAEPTVQNKREREWRGRYEQGRRSSSTHNVTT